MSNDQEHGSRSMGPSARAWPPNMEEDQARLGIADQAARTTGLGLKEELEEEGK